MQHTIQALRGCSALWVLLYHAHITQATHSGWWSNFTSYGYLGVDIFFVISGYIMALNTATASAGYMPSLRFALQRLWRIYSGWWPVFILCVLVLVWSQGWPLHKDLLGSWWLYSLNIETLLLPVTWTLTFELYFYAIVALSLLLAPRWRGKMLLGIALVIVLLNLNWFQQGRYTAAQLDQSHWGMYLFASPMCLEFALGYLLQRCWQPERQSAWRAGLPWLCLLIVSSSVLLWYAKHHATQPSGLAGFFHYPERAVLGGSLALSALALCMQWGQPLPRRASLWAGDISYMLYLVHLPVIWLFAAAWPLAQGHLRTAGIVLLSCLLASALHYGVEHPLYQALRRRMQGSRRNTKHAPLHGG